MKYIDSNGNVIQVDKDPIGSGGEAHVYRLKGQPGVAKIYHNQAKVHFEKLQHMVKNPPEIISSAHVDIAWPQRLLFDREGRLKGFVMPFIKDAHSIHNLMTPKSRGKLFKGFNWFYLHRVAQNLSRAIASIHAKGYVIGDLNESNILVHQNAMITIIDTDSFQVTLPSGKVVPCPVGKPEFTPVELIGTSLRELKRTQNHDLFGLGVLIFQVLMEGNHPYRGLGNPTELMNRIEQGLFYFGNLKLMPPLAPPIDSVGVKVRDAFITCFKSKKGLQRPTAQEWVKLLVNQENQLVKCNQNSDHWFLNGQCHHCARDFALSGFSQKPLTPPQKTSPSHPINLNAKSIRCQAVTKSGSQCRLKASSNQKYCHIHQNNKVHPTFSSTNPKIKPSPPFAKANNLSIFSGPGGTTLPSGLCTIPIGTLHPSNPVFIEVKPSKGYRFSHYTCDGGDCVLHEFPSGNTWIALHKISSSCRIHVTFKTEQFNVNVFSGIGGSTDVNGVTAINSGGKITINAFPNKGYRFTHWSCDVVDCTGIGSSLVLNNLTRDCTVKANFELNEITVTISSGLGGSTDPDGVIKVKQGEGLAIRAKALKGYRFTHWSCDIADCSGIGSSLNLSSLKSDCQVTAHFVDDQQPQKLNASPKQISTTIFYLVVILLCAVQFFRFFQLFQPSTELGLQDPNFGDLHLVVSGTFTQGTGTDPNHESDETPFTHTLTRNILVMETEVSRQMWADLKSAQPSLPNDPTKTSYGSGMNNPVQNNTWYEAVLFANLLSVERGFTRCYYKDASYTTPVDSTNYTSGSFYCNFDANGYRLPTEGEWEYFTRAGTTGPFSIDEPNYYSGNCSSCTSGTFPNLESVAVFCGNDAGRSEPVGSKDPNPWGLKDVHGNVWEWCWDWYSNNYPSGSATDYEGATSGSIRVVRGGSWMNGAWSCRSAIRAWNTPSNRIYNLGFRLVRTDP